MTNREKALEIANDAKEQVEAGGIVLDTPDAMMYAIALLLADISERLEEIEKNLPRTEDEILEAAQKLLYNR